MTAQQDTVNALLLKAAEAEETGRFAEAQRLKARAIQAMAEPQTTERARVERGAQMETLNTRISEAESAGQFATADRLKSELLRLTSA